MQRQKEKRIFNFKNNKKMTGKYFEFTVNDTVFIGRKDICKFLNISIYRLTLLTYGKPKEFNWNGHNVKFRIVKANPKVREYKHNTGRFTSKPIIKEIFLYGDLVLIHISGVLTFTYSKERFEELNPGYVFNLKL